MPFQARRFHDFRGRQLSLRAISLITGISRWTLQKRVNRGTELDRPVQIQPSKQKAGKPELTGDRERDVEMIVHLMHRRLARSRNAHR